MFKKLLISDENETVFINETFYNKNHFTYNLIVEKKDLYHC